MAITKVYVDQVSGNDAGAGTSGDPYLTIQNALDDLPTTGGIEVNVQGEGTITTALDMDSSGNTVSSTNRINIRQWYGQTQAVINCNNVAFQDNTALDWLSLQGLDILPVTHTGTMLGSGSGCDYWQVSDCRIINDGNQGSLAVGTYGVFVNNYIYGPADATNILNMTSTGGRAIGNYIVHNGSGWGIRQATGSLTYRNFIENTTTTGDGIHISNNSAACIENICFTSNTGANMTGNGIETLAAERACLVLRNYCERWENSFDFNNSQMTMIEGNVSVEPDTNHYLDYDSITLDASNLQIASKADSWIQKDALTGLYSMKWDKWLQLTAPARTDVFNHTYNQQRAAKSRQHRNF